MNNIKFKYVINVLKAQKAQKIKVKKEDINFIYSFFRNFQAANLSFRCKKSSPYTVK